MSACTIEEFRGFFLAKAFDVIGNGAYRKHLARCKESGDPWAVLMGGHLQAVQSHVREVNVAVAAIPPTSSHIGDICRDVMVSAQPPIRLHAGCATCAITGRRCMKCLDLSKTHKGHAHIYVDPRFCYFFMLLWYCNKLEYIVRSFTRTWLDSRRDTETFKGLCTAMQNELEPRIVSMHRLFVLAKDHVLLTLSRYATSQKHLPILELPVALK
jgi:hypothetical protein